MPTILQINCAYIDFVFCYIEARIHFARPYVITGLLLIQVVYRYKVLHSNAVV